jgi:hypothetical protein
MTGRRQRDTSAADAIMQKGAHTYDDLHDDREIDNASVRHSDLEMFRPMFSTRVSGDNDPDRMSGVQSN